MSAVRHVRLAIIGSGPAGYSAAIYSARAMLKPVLISGPATGGQLTITTDVENYPGFAETIQGPWLMDQMRAQAAHVGTAFIDDTVDAAPACQCFHAFTPEGFFFVVHDLIGPKSAQPFRLGGTGCGGNHGCTDGFGQLQGED